MKYILTMFRVNGRAYYRVVDNKGRVYEPNEIWYNPKTDCYEPIAKVDPDQLNWR